MAAPAGRENGPDRPDEIADPGRVERHNTPAIVLCLFRHHGSMKRIAKTVNRHNHSPLTSPLPARSPSDHGRFGCTHCMADNCRASTLTNPAPPPPPSRIQPVR
jgi:hypothetical protein